MERNATAMPHDRWWDTVDWRRTNADIARQVGVSRQAVHEARQRHGRSPNPLARSRPIAPDLQSRMYRIRATPATHRALQALPGPGAIGLTVERLLPDLQAPAHPPRKGRTTRLYRIYANEAAHDWLRAHTPLQVGEALRAHRRRFTSRPAKE